jgi:hypothetical protein
MLKSSSVSTLIVLLLLGCRVADGQAKRTDLVTGNIGISLLLPAGLQPFSEEKMALVREKGIAAKFIFSDPRADLILAINTFGSNADEKGFPKVVEEIKAAARKRNSEAQWLTNGLITVNGKRWLHLSFKDGPEVGELIDEYFVTDWIGQYVLLNFSCPPAKYESFKSAIQRSARSVRLELISDIDEIKGPVKPPREHN